MTQRHRIAAAGAAALLLLAGCQGSPPPARIQPTFYADLAAPGARVDEGKALAMINEYRARNGSPRLRLDPELSRIARDYAAVMAAADRMSHAVTPESMIGARLRSEGYAFAAAGENIAAGYRTLAEAFSGWRESPRHDRGMKDTDMTVMGIGIAQNPSSKYKVFWCLIFARPQSEAGGAPGVAGPPSLVALGGPSR